MAAIRNFEVVEFCRELWDPFEKIFFESHLTNSHVLLLAAQKATSYAALLEILANLDPAVASAVSGTSGGARCLTISAE